MSTALVQCGGCATMDTPTWTSRFIREGTPSIDLGGTPPAKVRPSMAPAPITQVRRSKTITADVEISDPQLKAAMAAIHEAPTLARHLRAARSYQRLGILDQALDYANAGVALAPRDPASHDALARLWRDSGLPAFGLPSAYRAVYLAPESAPARNTLGTLLNALGSTADAEDAFWAAVRIDGTAWYAWQNLCELAMRGGRTKQATALCQRASATRAAARASRKESNQP